MNCLINVNICNTFPKQCLFRMAPKRAESCEDVAFGCSFVLRLPKYMHIS